MAKRREGYPYWAYSTRRDWLRGKRAEGQRLLRALAEFRLGCAYLPPAADRNGGALIDDMEKWIKGPCREVWRKA